MKNFCTRLNHFLFVSACGKIGLSIFVVIGLVAIPLLIPKYSLANRLVKEARAQASMAADEWRGHSISRNVVFKDFKNIRGKGYVENLFTGKKTIEGVEWVRAIEPIIDEIDTLAVFSRYVKGLGSRKGYMNVYTGEVVIPDIFKHAWNFKDNDCAVVCAANDSLYVIDRQGEIISNRGFKMSNKLRFGFVFNDGLCLMESNNGKIGLIDEEGNWVLSPEYDWIIRNPRTGFYILTKDKLFGVVDSELNEILPIKYADIQVNRPFNDPRDDKEWYYSIGYGVTNVDGTRSYYDKEGRFIADSPYSELKELKFNGHFVKNGNWIESETDYMAYRIGNSWGLMTILGKRITAPNYSNIKALGKNRFVATLDNENEIIIDGKGKQIVE